MLHFFDGVSYRVGVFHRIAGSVVYRCVSGGEGVDFDYLFLTIFRCVGLGQCRWVDGGLCGSGLSLCGSMWFGDFPDFA